MTEPEEPAPTSVEESGTSVVDFATARLRRLRALEGPLDAAIANFKAVRAENEETHNRYRNYEWEAGDPDRPEDPELVAAGTAARAALTAAADELAAAQRALASAISQHVATGGLQLGDEVRSPNWQHRLVVATVFQPTEIILSEVTLTGDGRPVTTNWHNPTLDKDGHVIEDGLEPVRFERWAQEGLRAGGYCHPASRGPVAVD